MITEAVVRRWLLTSTDLTSLVTDRIGTRVDPDDGYPAVQLGAIQINPRSDATRQVDSVSEASIALYIHAGRAQGGNSQLPDTATAHAVSDAIVALASTISDSWWSDATSNRIVGRCRVVGVSSGTDPDTGGARSTVTLDFTVW